MLVMQQETFIFYFDFSTLDPGNESHNKDSKGWGEKTYKCINLKH